MYVEMQRTAPHPYGGLTKAPTIPGDIFKVVLEKDLRLHHRPAEFLLRKDVYVICCLDRNHYVSHHGSQGGQMFDRWTNNATMIKDFPWSPERPGNGITICKLYDPAKARLLLRRSRGRLELHDGSLVPFLTSGWDTSTHVYNGRHYRWSTTDNPTIALPLDRKGDYQVSLEIFCKGDSGGLNSGSMEINIEGHDPTFVSIDQFNQWIIVEATLSRTEDDLTPSTITIRPPENVVEKVAISAVITVS